MDRELDIAFGIDAGYLPHLGALIESIVRHAPGARFRFIILHGELPEERKALLESVAPEARYVWREVGDEDVPDFVEHGHFNRTTLYRLGLDHMAPADCRRVLYLDTDVIVTGDVREVYEADLGDAALGAVVDSYTDAAAFGAKWELPPSGLGYFNAGLLLVDLERVRREGLFAKAAAFMAERGPDLPFNDQDALNWTFWGQWKPLPPLWNVQRNSAIPAMSAELAPHLRFEKCWPQMVHYTGPEKPWVMSGYHPWSQLYWDNLARTPFYAEVVENGRVSVLDRLRIWLRWLRRRPPRTRSGASASA